MLVANARFAADLARLTGDDTPILAAVSGGPDSLALLLLLQTAIGPRCHAATVDHGLRPESADEAAFVAEICAIRRIPHATLTAAFPDRERNTANLSARARAYRYALLDAHADAIGARWIATGHHADDQAETLVMRLNRGSGVAGLAGVRTVSGRVIRPLLGWRRFELAAIVAAAGITPIDDPTNRDDRYDRARLRKSLADADWLDPVALATSAALLAEADSALDWSVDQLADRIVATAGNVDLDPAGLPAEILRRLVARCLAALDPDAAPRGALLARIVAELSAGATLTAGEILCTAGKDRWHFRLAPPRRSL